MPKYLIYISFILFLTGCSLHNTSSKKVKIEILHINDTHSHIEPTKTAIRLNGVKTYVYSGGYAKIAKYIKNKKQINHNILVLHAGDAVQGTLYYTLFKGKADIKLLNLMNIDAMTIGNHEWDNGAYSFARNFADLANFPIISCDINASNNHLLKNIIKPYIIKKIDNKKFAIIGDSINSSVISNPGPSIKFLNYLTSAKKYVKKLEKQGINKIILLTHLGYERDKFLASEIKGIDIIVGGHSHTLLGNFNNLGLHSEGKYPTVIDHNGSKTLIVTSWKWGLVIGDLNVTFDNKGNIVSYKGTPVMLISDIFIRKHKVLNYKQKLKIEKLISSMPNIKIEKNDKKIWKIINRYKPEVDKLLKQTIAKATTNLINVRLPEKIDLNTNKLLTQGSMITPIVALSMYEKAEKNGGCDFSIQNAGAVRISIPKGNISVGEIYTLLPFNNTLVTLRLKGSVIKKMLEKAVERSLIKKTNTGAFPYLGNAKITINIKNPPEKRIISFKIRNSKGIWVDINTSKIYKIATNSYIANGGDYYSEMLQGKDKTNTGYLDTEIFINYIKRHKQLSPISKNELPVKIK